MTTPDYIHLTNRPAEKLKSVLEDLKPDHVAYLVDENTRKHCLPLLKLENDPNIIEIQSGEPFKNIETCSFLWSKLTALGFSRKSILINLGGGVIGDMGGFAASTYKRGIRFINIPTTLLAAVDANIGGKLGIDFEGFKNHIGVFNDPDAVIISDLFLKTLPQRQLRSGFAEVIKHGLIFNKPYWEEVKQQEFPNLDWTAVISKSVEIKSQVVMADPKENGLRKILNFGHTIGHGIETWYLNNGKDLLHGEAIAAGMVMEAQLAKTLSMLNKEELESISNYLLDVYGKIDLPKLSDVLPIMGQDKKNTDGQISFSLLETIGRCAYDKQVSRQNIEDAFDYYSKQS